MRTPNGGIATILAIYPMHEGGAGEADIEWEETGAMARFRLSSLRHHEEGDR